MQRRDFLRGGLAAGAGLGLWPWRPSEEVGLQSLAARRPPAFSVIPVVGDGHWIWKEPPKETGYLEPRSYSLDVGIELEGIGNATQVLSTTSVPIPCPEQKIEHVAIETQGCEATLRKLASDAAQLIVSAPRIAKGQVVSAVAKFRLTISKQYQAYEEDQFPAKQKLPLEIERGYLQDSPGIQTKTPEVRKLARELAEGLTHPWQQARAFAQWIPKHIRPQIGSYTSVQAAVENRRGDCEEMAGLFVALCRVMDIPARLVWVPNHTWAEFFLMDHKDEGHWIPAHTACYFWFGYTGAHELVIQKGDRIDVPERHKTLRLLEDWTQWQGRHPRTRYTAQLTPLAGESDSDAGPGQRTKDENGEWKVTGSHEFDKYLRR